MKAQLSDTSDIVTTLGKMIRYSEEKFLNEKLEIFQFGLGPKTVSILSPKINVFFENLQNSF